MANIFGASPAGFTTSTGTSQPWGPQQPYIAQGFGQAQNLFNASPYGFSVNPSDYIAETSPLTTQSWNMAANIAKGSQPLIQGQQQYLTDQINGKYLNPNTNPYLAGAVNDALGLAKSSFNSQYGGQAGSNVNNSGFQEGLTRTLGNVANNAYSNAYQQGLQNQAYAAAMAPNSAALQYLPSQMLGRVGSAQEEYQQAQLGAQQQAYQSPFKALQQYQQGISGNYGNTTTQSQPYFTNPAASALGLATAGLGLYNGLNNAGVFNGLSQLFSSPYSATSAIASAPDYGNTFADSMNLFGGNF